MARDHKYAGAKAVVETVMPPDRIAPLVAHVASRTRRGVFKVQFEGAGPDLLNFSVVAFGGNAAWNLRFHVDIAASDRVATMRTSIDSYVMTQDRFAGVIPSGRWKMPTYKVYKQFMVNLGAAARSEDPAALVVITERS